MKLIDRPEWADDPRFAERLGWAEHLESDIRPAIEAWLADKTRLEATDLLSKVGIAAGPVHTSPEIIADEHVAMFLIEPGEAGRAAKGSVGFGELPSTGSAGGS